MKDNQLSMRMIGAALKTFHFQHTIIDNYPLSNFLSTAGVIAREICTQLELKFRAPCRYTDGNIQFSSCASGRLCVEKRPLNSQLTGPTFSISKFGPNMSNQKDVTNGHQEEWHHESNDEGVLGVHVEGVIIHVWNAHSDVLLKRFTL